MLKELSFWDLCEKYRVNKQEAVILLQNSKRKELEQFIRKENLFVYGRKKDKNSLIKSILCWCKQHCLITKRVV